MYINNLCLGLLKNKNYIFVKEKINKKIFINHLSYPFIYMDFKSNYKYVISDFEKLYYFKQINDRFNKIQFDIDELNKLKKEAITCIENNNYNKKAIIK